jgi:hypothetical protein
MLQEKAGCRMSIWDKIGPVDLPLTHPLSWSGLSGYRTDWFMKRTMPMPTKSKAAQAKGGKMNLANCGSSLDALRDPVGRVRYSGARAYEINWRR